MGDAPAFTSLDVASPPQPIASILTGCEGIGGISVICINHDLSASNRGETRRGAGVHFRLSLSKKPHG